MDNSEFARNGDYLPTRFGSQKDAINFIFSAKMRAHPENMIGLMSMGGKGPEILVTLTQDYGKFLAAMHESKIGGNSNICTSIQVAHLALKHRPEKRLRQRIILFVGSPVTEDEKTLIKLAKKMKKNNVSVDFICFGEICEENTAKLNAFIDAINNILQSYHLGPGGLPNEHFDFGVDPNMDPELALALQMSLQEEQARQETQEGKSRENNDKHSNETAQKDSTQENTEEMDKGLKSSRSYTKAFCVEFVSEEKFTPTEIEKNPPNPVIRPLLVRPQARDEPAFLWRDRKKRILHTNVSNSNTLDYQSSTPTISNDYRNEEFNKWKQFIFAYAQDMYNLSRPPSPPTKLRAPYFIPPRPFNESERIAALERYNILPGFDGNLDLLSFSNNSSQRSEKERLQRLVVAIRDFFSTPIAFISLIDENRCYFKSEIGLNMRDIDRDISFCAHTLLSINPMVILDASKDWRFKDPPYFRFYAGAPIITSDGYAIGTICVIDTNARLSFTSQDQRPLSQFARMAMDEIIYISQINKKKNPFEANFQKMSLKSYTNSPELNFVSTTNNYQVIPNNKDIVDNYSQKSTSEYVFRNFDEDLKVKSSQNFEKTTQSSIKSDEMTSFKDSAFYAIPSDSRIGGKHQIMADAYRFNSLQNSPSSRTKYNKEQKSAFHSSLISENKTVSPNYSSNILENKGYNKNYIESTRVSLDINKKENVQTLKNSELTPPSTPVKLKINFSNSKNENTISKENTTLNSHSFSSNTSHPSVFATHVIACTLGLDLVYIVQILPSNSTFLKFQKNEGELPNVYLDILASWGLPNPPPVLDPALHLRALRSEGGLIYRNPLHLNEDCLDYKVGILVPLWRDDINESNTENSLKELLSKSTSGVVLAGFAKKERTSKGFSSDEIQYLRKFGGVLEKVLKLSNIK
ncbi:hypothetical protein MERGE_003019 [Pneumocystis wakefieldiae]|uniref:VWFA domain-containing protein n=1 Tax=Pneumocystis wakefieldiae TaxID=38082 RepID=A0A899FYX5_9ASCO|nr:hypothetical protein MERGE_003019 [Pneumocystis wakefieldiae]